MTDNERKLRWAKANKEKTLAARKAWREANPGYDKQWRKKNPERTRAANRKWREANPEQWRKLKGQPEPTRPEPEFCECCGRWFLSITPHLDHSHSTGVFRGWLCSQCNTGIGLLGDDREGLKKALAYLERADANP